MKLIINILCDRYLNKVSLKSFIDNIHSQNSGDVELVLKRNQDLDEKLQAMIKTDFPMIRIIDSYSEVNLATEEQNYWLNLSVADGLLPNAIMQWQTILQRHHSALLLLTTLNNNANLQRQIGIAIDDCNEVHVATLKSILGLPVSIENDQINLKEQLKMLVGLQAYKLMDKRNRYRQTFEAMNLLGRNILYQVSRAELSQWDGNFAKVIINKLVNIPFLIQVKRPTLILNDDDWDQFAAETISLFRMPPTILDQELLDQYHEFIIQKLALAMRKNKQISKQHQIQLKQLVKSLSGGLKRRLTLALPMTYVNQFLERN